MSGVMSDGGKTPIWGRDAIRKCEFPPFLPVLGPNSQRHALHLKTGDLLGIHDSTCCWVSQHLLDKWFNLLTRIGSRHTHTYTQADTSGRERVDCTSCCCKNALLVDTVEFLADRAVQRSFCFAFLNLTISTQESKPCIMDFRSQLSAFQSGGGSRSGGGGGGNNDRDGPGRSPNNRGGGGGGYHGYNNRDHHGRGGGGYDRRRPRDWNNNHHYSPGRGGGGPPHSRRRYHSPDRDGLGDLRHHGYRICRGIPPNPTPEEHQRKAKHLALLVICIEDLPYEHIWQSWCDSLKAAEGAKDDYYISVVCHAKYPKQVQSDWLRQRLLVYPPKSGRGNSYLDPDFLTRTPNWGSVEITRAMLDLLHSGLKIGNDREKDLRFSANRFLVRRPAMASDAEEDETIPPVDQFLYVSETCLPTASANEFFDVLQDTTVSWVNARHRKDDDTPKNAYENDQFAGIHRKIPGQYRWKADQWVALCRRHASQILGMDRPHISPKYHLWQSFREINASDEMYIPTSLALLGFLRFSGSGDDTQRSRSLSMSGPDEGKPNDPKSPSSSATATNSGTSANQYKFVVKRPVTYTDWTGGMRNPMTFAKGLADFSRVARLARTKGCLVARKFALFVAAPGTPKEEVTITGNITAEEWQEALEKMQTEIPLEAPKPQADLPKVESTKVVDNPESKEEKETEEEGDTKQEDERSVEKEADDDDEEEENQL